MPRFIDISGTAPIAAAAEARAAINAPGNGGVIVDFTDYGACDGITDDRAAFVAALAVLGDAGGGTLQLPPTSIALVSTDQGADGDMAIPMLLVPANTKIVGTPGATAILFTSDDDDANRSLIGSAGDNVTIDGVTFRRNSNCSMSIIVPGAFDGFHLRNCVLDGQRSTYAKYCHGVQLDLSGAKSNLTLKGCTVTGTNFGLLYGFGADPMTTIVVDDCTFTGNYADDLGFNFPSADATDVTVVNSRFTDNASTVYTGGYAVAFAHVVNAVVRDCYFENYYNEAIHAEDYSANIVISGNRLVKCGTDPVDDNVTDLDRGGIVITDGCSDIVITGNTLDHRENENFLHGIVVKKLTAPLTPGGRTMIAPSRVTVTDNIILCGNNYQGMWINATDTTVKGNRVIGGGAVAAGVWDGANEGWGINIEGVRSVIDGNAVSGFRYGISGPIINVGSLGAWNTRKGLGNPGNVTSNILTDCYAGIVGVTPGTLNISTNTLSNCVRPLVVAEGEYAALPVCITNNFANGCTYPIEADGRLIIEQASGGSTVTIGTGRTINIVDNLGKVPVGTVFQFSGGGVFTVTTAVTLPRLNGSHALVGDVTVADITASEYGASTTMSHSTTPANNYYTFANNTDTVNSIYLGKSPDDITVGESVFPRSELTSSTVASGNGVLRLTYFTAKKTETINSVRTITGTTAGVTPTLCRIGIFTATAAGAVTLVASTANDTSLWVSASTVYTKALSAPFTKVAGTRYAVGILVVGAATAPTFVGRTNVSTELIVSPTTSAYTGGSLTDLPSSGSVVGTSAPIYAALLP